MEVDEKIMIWKYKKRSRCVRSVVGTSIQLRPVGKHIKVVKEGMKWNTKRISHVFLISRKVKIKKKYFSYIQKHPLYKRENEESFYSKPYTEERENFPILPCLGMLKNIFMFE